MPTLDFKLSILAHAALLVVAAACAVRYRSRFSQGGGALHTLVVVCLAASPLAALLLPRSVAMPLFGTEGVTEALTEGILAALAISGVRSRQWWIAAAASLLLCEELDWGFVLLPFHSPAPPSFLHSRSGTLNFHNTVYLGWLWKPLPMLATITLALRPWPGRLEGLLTWLDVPRLRRSGAWGVPLGMALSVLVRRLVEPRFAEEALELAFVAMIASIWVSSRSAASSPS